MASATATSLRNFTAELRSRHAQRLPSDQRYEAMMYQARMAPDPESLTRLIDYVAAERQGHVLAAPPRIPSAPDAYAELAILLSSMQWPDAAPLRSVGALLPGWDTLHVTTLLHSTIPDYAIFGPAEARSLQELGFGSNYVAEPAAAVPAYAAYLSAIRTIREAAGFDQVPESHHYLTRIIQTALEERSGG